MMDQSFQDVQFFTRFKCAGACNAGVLFRAEKRPEGIRGIFVSLKEGDLNSYKLTIDPSGREISRERITDVTYGTGRTGTVAGAADAAGARGGGGGAAGGGRGGGRGGDAAAAGGAAGRGGDAAAPQAGRGGDAGGRAGGGARGGGGGGDGRTGGPTFLLNTPLPTPLPELAMPAYGLGKQPNGAWDQVNIIYDSNIVRSELNRTNEMGPSVTGELDTYGPIAIYVGGTSAVQFRDMSYKDLFIRTIPPEQVSSRFRMQQLEEFTYGWGAAIADFNRDNRLDITVGPYLYLGPEFTRRKEVYLGAVQTGYPANMVSHAADVNGDGWTDILATESRAQVLYVNPGNQNRRWQRHAPAVPVGGEAAVMADVNKDGRADVIATMQGYVAYASWDPANPTGPWIVHRVSEQPIGYGHAAGAGDVNGDGRTDILGTAGWWEQPAMIAPGTPWRYHPVAFGRWGRSQSAGGGDIEVWDVNGDGLNDVVSALHGHGWGLAWWEQKKSPAGEITFTRHMIMDNFSTPNTGGITFTQLHASAAADMDGDGIRDFITGKRYWSHGDGQFDPDGYGEAVLYVYRTVRDKAAPGGARFVPERVHNRSGVGSQIAVQDLNGDKRPDIVTSARQGTFIFWNNWTK
jgi:hypothetical protein